MAALPAAAWGSGGGGGLWTSNSRRGSSGPPGSPERTPVIPAGAPEQGDTQLVQSWGGGGRERALPRRVARGARLRLEWTRRPHGGLIGDPRLLACREGAMTGDRLLYCVECLGGHFSAEVCFGFFFFTFLAAHCVAEASLEPEK